MTNENGGVDATHEKLVAPGCGRRSEAPRRAGASMSCAPGAVTNLRRKAQRAFGNLFPWERSAFLPLLFLGTNHGDRHPRSEPFSIPSGNTARGKNQTTTPHTRYERNFSIIVFWPQNGRRQQDSGKEKEVRILDCVAASRACPRGQSAYYRSREHSG